MSTEKQNKQLVARLVEHQEFFSNLSVDDAQWAIQNPKDVIVLFTEAIKNRKKIASLLKFTGSVTTPATIGKFIARGHFKVDTSDTAPVKISYLGDNFTEWFLTDDGKIEEPKGETTLRYHTLLKGSVDEPIITELGGAKKAETSLQEVFAFMQKQPKGENGALLANGCANIFYVRDANEVLRAVYVSWYGDGWRVCAPTLLGLRTGGSGATRCSPANS